MFASLVPLNGFYLLLSTQLTADLIPELIGGSMFHLLSHFYAKTPFGCIETVANNILNCQLVVVFGRLWANATPTFNTDFSLTNVYVKMVNTLPSDIFNSSAISRNFNLWSAKMSLWSFLAFFGTTAELGQPECSVYVSVRPRLKLAYHFLTIASDGAESE